MNNFVRYLDQFNVLSPNHSKIYDEYSDANEQFAIKIDTKIEDHLLKLFNTNPRSVIMSGNAGDGKTRLCRSIYENFTGEPNLVWPESGIMEILFNEGKIRIVKDLSELTDTVILKELTLLQSYIQNQHDSKIYYLIAANEGKLTKFLSQHESLSYLREKISGRFLNYEENDDQLYLVNLQDVTSSIYADRILKEWNEEKNWTACEECNKKNKCVINLNHRRLTENQVRERIVEQYRLADCLGIHITMREILIHMSYVITGGLTCDDIMNADYSVIVKHSEYAYYNNFYGIQLSEGSSEEMSVVNIFKKFDPGNVSVSTIDDFLLNGDLSLDDTIIKNHSKIFDNEIDMLFGYIRRNIDLYRIQDTTNEAKELFEFMPKLRRKYFFEDNWNDNQNGYELIPYRYFYNFIEIINDKSKHSGARKEIIQGLNAAFSKKLISDSETQLFAVNENLLIHQAFTSGQVKLNVEIQRDDIDFLPSKIYMVLGDQARLEVRLPVFEYLYRVSRGGLFSTLKHEVEILLNTFRNDLINTSELEEYELCILSIDENKGEYSVKTIDIG